MANIGWKKFFDEEDDDFGVEDYSHYGLVVRKTFLDVADDGELVESPRRRRSRSLDQLRLKQARPDSDVQNIPKDFLEFSSVPRPLPTNAPTEVLPLRREISRDKVGYYLKDNARYYSKESAGYYSKENAGYYSKESTGYYSKENAGYYSEDSAGTDDVSSASGREANTPTTQSQWTSESQWSLKSDDFESEDERWNAPTGRGLIADYAPHITANDRAKAYAQWAAQGARRRVKQQGNSHGKGYGNGHSFRNAAWILDGRTTVMVQNLPQTVTQDQFAQFVKRLGFFEKCDFIYLPTCIHLWTSMGYGFINFLDVSSAAEFLTMCEPRGLRWRPARIQGSEALMAHLQKRLTKLRNPKFLPIFPLQCRDSDDAQQSR